MNNNRLKFSFGILLFLFFIILATGCSPEPTNSNGGTQEDGVANDGEITVGYYVEVSNFDPIKGSSGGDHALLWPIYDTLVSFTSGLEPEPGLAESWEFPDENTILLHLRDGVQFHDGTAFDAEAVKFNIERINSDDSKVSDLRNIESVEVVDPLTVKLNLKQPDSSIILALSDRGGMMVSPTAVQKQGDSYSQQPVGTGPFKMVEHVPNGEIVYELFDGYWGIKPSLDKITVKIMVDENTRINGLKSGEIDVATRIPPGTVQSLEEDPNLVVHEDISLLFKKLYVNSLMPPFDNKNFRLAVLHGINREELLAAVNFGKGEPANQAFPSDYWASDPGMVIEYDPEKSKKLLKEAGLENASFTIITQPNAYETRMAEAVKGQMASIGINVEIEIIELNVALQKFFTDKSGHAILTSWTGRPDPQMTINLLFTKDSFYHVGESTEEIMALISQAGATYDQDERAELYKEINRIAILKEGLMIPLIYNPEIIAMKKEITGYEANLLGKPIFKNLKIEK